MTTNIRRLAFTGLLAACFAVPTVPTASAPCTPENCPSPPCNAVFCPPPPTDPKEYKKFVKQLEKEARKAEKRATTP